VARKYKEDITAFRGPRSTDDDVTFRLQQRIMDMVECALGRQAKNAITVEGCARTGKEEENSHQGHRPFGR